VKKSILMMAVIGLLGLAGQLFAGTDGHRIAGILAFGEDDFRTIIELPDGEQRLVEIGDFIGDVQIIQIDKDQVTLLFPVGERQMQVSAGDYIHQSFDSYVDEEPVIEKSVNYGIVASDFNRVLDKALDDGMVSSVRGLETLQRLNPSARLVAVSYLADPDSERTAIESVESGVDILRQAILAKREIRISVEGDPSVLDFYVMPNSIH